MLLAETSPMKVEGRLGRKETMQETYNSYSEKKKKKVINEYITDAKNINNAITYFLNSINNHIVKKESEFDF